MANLGILYVSILLIFALISGISLILYSHINNKKRTITQTKSTQFDAIGGLLIGVSIVCFIIYLQM